VPPITPGGNMPYATPGGNQAEANESKPILIESAAIRSFYTSTPSHQIQTHTERPSDFKNKPSTGGVPPVRQQELD